jgi:aspartate carbamoyltransferase catalytic subunit
MKKDLLGLADLTPDDIYRVLETAEAMREVGQRTIRKPTLRGKTVVEPFYEPSTRTRTSFEIAACKAVERRHLNVAVAASSVLGVKRSSTPP